LHIQVRHDWSLVGRVDRVGGTASSSVQRMVPFRGHSCTSRYRDNGSRDGLAIWVDTAIANDVIRVDVLDGLAVKEVGNQRRGVIGRGEELTPSYVGTRMPTVWPAETPLTHSSWKMVWAETLEARTVREASERRPFIVPT
jgi:hypothetical protein